MLQTNASTFRRRDALTSSVSKQTPMSSASWVLGSYYNTTTDDFHFCIKIDDTLKKIERKQHHKTTRINCHCKNLRPTRIHCSPDHPWAIHHPRDDLARATRLRRQSRRIFHQDVEWFRSTTRDFLCAENSTTLRICRFIPVVCAERWRWWV